MSNILLIEDEKSIADLYTFKLTSSGHIVVQAEHGLTGLKALDTFTPDIILLDLLMPVMDGEKFLELLRKKKGYQSIPVIVLTNISRDEAPKTIWHYRIAGYFIKANHTPTELVRLIENQLKP